MISQDLIGCYAYRHAVRVGVELFATGKRDHFIARLFKRFARIAKIAALFNKVVDRKRRIEPRGAGGRQCMVRPREIVAERFGRVVSEEYAARVSYLRQQIERLVDTDLKMLRSERVRDVERVVDILSDNDFSVVFERLFCYFVAREFRELSLQFNANIVCKPFTRRD